MKSVLIDLKVMEARNIMRRLGMLLSGSLALSLASVAYAEEAKVYYKDGTRIEFEDFDIKFNVQLQPRYSYTDIDVGDREKAGVETDDQDSSSFDMRRARFVISGNAQDKEFSYKLQNDFASEDGGGDLKDAWLQWNGDPAKIQFGQYKQPFGREVRVSSTNLFFVDRSFVTDFFTPDRAQGAMAHGGIGSMGHWYASVNNGESSGEGRNQEGVDANVQGVWGVDFSSENYGSRGEEGDFREDQTFAWTAGAAAAFGQGNVEGVGDFDKTDANADFGVRCAGTELYGEFFFSEVDLDTSTVAGVSDPSNAGLFVSLMHNLNEKLGAGYRYAFMDLDNAIQDASGIDDFQEHSFVVNYYFNGHNLKLQNGITYAITSLDTSSNLDDFRYDLQLSGYF